MNKKGQQEWGNPCVCFSKRGGGGGDMCMTSSSDCSKPSTTCSWSCTRQPQLLLHKVGMFKTLVNKKGQQERENPCACFSERVGGGYMCSNSSSDCSKPSTTCSWSCTRQPQLLLHKVGMFKTLVNKKGQQEWGNHCVCFSKRGGEGTFV